MTPIPPPPFPETEKPSINPKIFPRLFVEEGHSDQTEKFVRFHMAHSDLWWEFVRVAESRRVLGLKKYNARAIFHIIKYERETAAGREVKWMVNNNHTPYYARMYEHIFHCPGFFETRQSVADELDLSNI